MSVQLDLTDLQKKHFDRLQELTDLGYDATPAQKRIIRQIILKHSIENYGPYIYCEDQPNPAYWVEYEYTTWDNRTLRLFFTINRDGTMDGYKMKTPPKGANEETNWDAVKYIEYDVLTLPEVLSLIEKTIG